MYLYDVLEVSDDAVGALGSSDKKWFVYLSEALQASTKDETCLEDHYFEYNKHLRQLMEWCHPHTYLRDVKLWPEGSNLLKFLPCGLVNDIKKHDKYLFIWEITVNTEFYINVTFLRFEMQDSGEGCGLSALKIGAYHRGDYRSESHRSYCGYRRPWSETILSNSTVMAIIQKDLNYSFNVSFMYCIIDRDDFLGSKIYHKDNIPNGLQQVYYHIEHSHCIRWTIKLPICYVVHFSVVKLLNFVGQFYIYDGPSEKYSLFSQKQTTHHLFMTYVDIKSEYHTTVVKLMPLKSNKNFTGNKVMELSFKKKMLDITALLNFNSKTRVQNKGHTLLTAVYSISGEVAQYPNVTFDIRRFQGWNEGSCNMGGFALMHQMSHEYGTFVTSGPYCPGGSPNQPFVTDHGPQYIVLSSKETLLIIYAYGPEYWIDLDVIVSVSLCEGLFDLPLLCQAVLAVSQATETKTQWNNFQLNCNSIHRFNDISLSIRLIRVTGCVVAQVVMCSWSFHYEVELLSSMHVNFQFRSHLHHNISGSISYISYVQLFWRNRESGSQYARLLTSTQTLDIGDVTSLTYRQESKVSYHDSSLTIIILQKDNESNLINECDLINQSAVMHSREIYDNMEDLKLTNLCVTGYYQKIKSYVYSIVPRYMTQFGSLSNAYFDIQEQSCGDFNTASSDLTITVRAAFTQTFHMTSNGTIEIEVPNVSILIALEKHDACSTLIFNFRVKLMALHDVTNTAIIENIFQVFLFVFNYYLKRLTCAAINNFNSL